MVTWLFSKEGENPSFIGEGLLLPYAWVTRILKNKIKRFNKFGLGLGFRVWIMCGSCFSWDLWLSVARRWILSFNDLFYCRRCCFSYCISAQSAAAAVVSISDLRNACVHILVMKHDTAGGRSVGRSWSCTWVHPGTRLIRLSVRSVTINLNGVTVHKWRTGYAVSDNSGSK